MKVPAGETFEYRCVLEVKRPGRFEGGMDIHLEDNGIRTVSIRITGTVKGELPHDPPPK